MMHVFYVMAMQITAYRTDIEEAEVPADMADEVAEWRNTLMETVAETDEALIEKFLETGELSVDELKKGIREGVLKHGLVPMLCGSAFKNKGVQLVLDAVIDYTETLSSSWLSFFRFLDSFTLPAKYSYC